MGKRLGTWANAPLALSLIEMVFHERVGLSEEVSKFSRFQASGNLPKFIRGEIQELEVKRSPNEVRFNEKKSAFYWFANESETVAFRLLPDRLTFFDADYVGNFTGSLARFLSFYEAWIEAAPNLVVLQVKLRAIDVVVMPGDLMLSDWLKPEWRAGKPVGDESVGLAIRDRRLADGALHVRVRDAVLKKGNTLQLPPDLFMGLSFKLPKALIGPFEKTVQQALVDTERVFELAAPLDNKSQMIFACLKSSHEELKLAFNDIFESTAIKYFKGDN